MSTVAFPVRQDGEVGCTDITMRKIMGALFTGTGVVSGLEVTGGSSAAYHVSEGVAVCSKGTSDGKTLAYVEASDVACSGNSSGYPRIDCVWVAAHDKTQGDPDNLVTLGVTEGTPAATPVEPDPPAGATMLATMQLAAGATNTQQAVQVSTAGYTSLYGTSRGLLVNRRYIANKDINIKTQKTLMSQYFDLPTDRVVTFKAATNMTPRDRTQTSQQAKGEARVNIYFYLDGEQVAWLSNYCDEWATARWTEYTMTVPAGRHLARMDVKSGDDWTTARFWCYSAAPMGQQFQLFDMGVPVPEETQS